MIKFNFNKDEDILYIDYIGNINEDDIKDLYAEVSKIELPDKLYIFQNEIHAEFINSFKLISIAVDFYKSLSSRHKNVEIAVWQTEPVKTAYSFMFKNNFDLSNLRIQIFYTKKAALEWLKKD